MENNETSQPTAVDKIKKKSGELKDKTMAWLRARGRATKEFWNEVKKMSWIQLSVAFILLITGTWLSIRTFYDSQEAWRTYFLFFLIIAGVGVGTFVWVKFTRRFYEKIIYYIAIHKWTRKLVAGGSYCYFEYKDPEKVTSKKKLMEPIGITITSLIAFLGIATTIISVILKIDSGLNTKSPILWGIMALITPILASPLIPIAWSLDDSQMKTWSAGNKTNWTVSSRYKARFNGFVSLGVVISNLRSGLDSQTIRDQLNILFAILKAGILVMFISIGLFIIIYYAWFRNYLRVFSAKAANIATNETTLVEKIAAKTEDEDSESETSETDTSAVEVDATTSVSESPEEKSEEVAENSPLDNIESNTDEDGELNPNKNDA